MKKTHNNKNIINTKNLYKSILLIIFSLIYTIIPIIIIYFIGINYEKIPIQYKIIYLIIINILFILFLIHLYKKDLKKDFKNFQKDYKSIIKTAFKYWIIGLGIMFISNLIISSINGGKIARNEKEIRNQINDFPILMLFQASIYAPFVEEMLYRKSIRNIFNNPIIYIIVSGLVFGGLHIISDINSISFLYIIPYGALGCAFAALYNKTDNIFSSIFIHSFHNTTAILLIIFSKFIR